MLERSDAVLARSVLEFTVRCAEFERDPRLVAGCERLARFGLTRTGPEADRIVRAALRGLAWQDAAGRIRRFERDVARRADLAETRAWLSARAQEVSRR
jgi:hypothetical protein